MIPSGSQSSAGDTPFFEDNEQMPSIFITNSEFQQKSAYELFNQPNSQPRSQFRKKMDARPSNFNPRESLAAIHEEYTKNSNKFDQFTFQKSDGAPMGLPSDTDDNQSNSSQFFKQRVSETFSKRSLNKFNFTKQSKKSDHHFLLPKMSRLPRTSKPEIIQEKIEIQVFQDKRSSKGKSEDDKSDEDESVEALLRENANLISSLALLSSSNDSKCVETRVDNPKQAKTYQDLTSKEISHAIVKNEQKQQKASAPQHKKQEVQQKSDGIERNKFQIPLFKRKQHKQPQICHKKESIAEQKHKNDQLSQASPYPNPTATTGDQIILQDPTPKQPANKQDKKCSLKEQISMRSNYVPNLAKSFKTGFVFKKQPFVLKKKNEEQQFAVKKKAEDLPKSKESSSSSIQELQSSKTNQKPAFIPSYARQNDIRKTQTANHPKLSHVRKDNNPNLLRFEQSLSQISEELFKVGMKQQNMKQGFSKLYTLCKKANNPLQNIFTQATLSKKKLQQ